jgi:hypothetical protein
LPQQSRLDGARATGLATAAPATVQLHGLHRGTPATPARQRAGLTSACLMWTVQCQSSAGGESRTDDARCRVGHLDVCQHMAVRGGGVARRLVLVMNVCNDCSQLVHSPLMARLTAERLEQLIRRVALLDIYLQIQQWMYILLQLLPGCVPRFIQSTRRGSCKDLTWRMGAAQ